MQAIRLVLILTCLVSPPPAAAEEPPSVAGAPFFAAISVADVGVSAAWYSRVLGFETLNTMSLPEEAGRIVLLGRPDAFLELVEHRDARSPEALEPPVTRRFHLHGPFKIGFLVDDLDATIKRLAALEVPLRGRVVTERDGSFRSLQVEDPDGVVIQLFERLAGENMQATGEFEVDLKPLEPSAKGSAGVTLGRMSIDKTFRGDLEATSRGEMLSAMTPVKGSAGYVAIEQVTGTLHGKRGTFVLQHFGVMSHGENRLVLEVVPDSGTGELANLSGKMTIEIEGGKHSYTFDYSLN